MTMLRWDRNLLGLERSLGLRSERGISRQSNKDAPPIEQLLDSIKAIARRWVSATNREIRTSAVLKRDALGLFDDYGPTIWPDAEVRPSWLEHPSADAYEGRYPTHLYYSNPDDREVLSSYFCDLVVEKCIKYHDNQLQKHRRLSKVHSATPTKQDVDSEDDNDDSALLDRLEASVEAAGEIDEAEIIAADSRPTWAPVNKQPEVRRSPELRETSEEVAAPAPSMPAPPSPVSVMTVAESEPSYGDFQRYYVTGGESPEPELQPQQRLRASAQADRLRVTEERRDSAIVKDASRAGSAPAHPGSVGRKRPRTMDPDKPVFRVKRKRGGAKWSWMFTFKIDPQKLRRILAGERVAPPIVNEASDYWTEDEDEPSRASVDIDWHDRDDPIAESKPEPEDEAEQRPQVEPEADTVHVGSSRSKSVASWGSSSVSNRGRDAGERQFSPSEPDDSATPIAEHATVSQDKDANAGAEVSEDVEMADADTEISRAKGVNGVENLPTAPLPSGDRINQKTHVPEPALPRKLSEAIEVKRSKERQTETNNLRGIIADAILKDPERRTAVDIPSFSSGLAHLLEQHLYQRCVTSGAVYEAKVRQMKRTLRTDARLTQDLIRCECGPLDVIRVVMESIVNESSGKEPILIGSSPREPDGIATEHGPAKSPVPVKKQAGLAEAQRRASDAAAETATSATQAPAMTTTRPKQPTMSPSATPVRRPSSHDKPASKPPSMVKPLVTQPRHDQIVGFRASAVASPTACAFEETRIDDIAPPSGNPANSRPLSAAPTQGKFQIAPPNTHRCVCQKQPSPYDAGQLIQCGNCKVMQHKICMGVPAQLPRGHLYCCEQCRPDAHVETVKALQQGRRIWEMRANNFMNQQLQQQHRASNTPQVQAPPPARILQSSVPPGHAHPEPRPPTLPSQSPSVQPQVVSFGNSLPAHHMKQVNKPRTTFAPPYETEIMSQDLGRRIMGDMIHLPVVEVILKSGSNWTEDQLLDLKAALIEVPAGGRDLSLLAKHLFKSRHAFMQDVVAPAPAMKQQSASTSDHKPLELDVEVNWNRNLDFNDSLPMPDATTAEEFFLQLEAELPDEIRDEQKMIKEVRANSLTDLKCGPFSRIVRGKAGDAGLRSVRKKLKSLEKDVEPELQFFIVWQDKVGTASVGA